MKPYGDFKSKVVPLAYENVDTDQIIPARFLKTTTKNGLGRALFCDWRYDEGGKPKLDFILNQPHLAGAEILLAGNNFGCGSSREHAPWALADFGFRALISTSFADIFRNNCLKNGILPIQVDRAVHHKLFRLTDETPSIEVEVKVGSQTLVLPGGEVIPFPIDPYSKKCLLKGLDDIGYVLAFSAQIAAYESAHR